jgi:uncharacterized hydrophobic protein (TIGR00341 family)
VPLRLIEARLPIEPGQLDEALGDATVVDRWVVGTSEGATTVHALVDTERTEAFADRIRERFGEQEIRLVFIAVEATMPEVEEEPEEEKVQDDEATPGRLSREELEQDVREGARLTPVFAALVFFSTVVAAVGLVRDDVAIVIGAMVIAPLLGPNMALALAATLGDSELARTAFKTIGVGVLVAAVSAIAFGLIFTVDPSVPSIADRTRAGLGDIALGLAAGAAGTLAFTGGLPSALVGVMVAVALLPPLVVSGLLAGAGYIEGAVGAVMLVGANVACINLAAVGTFLAQGVRPRSWWEADRAKRAVRRAVIAWVLLLALLVATILVGDVGLDIS